MCSVQPMEWSVQVWYAVYRYSIQCAGMVCSEHAARCTLYRNGVQCIGNMYNVQARCSSKMYSVQTRCAVYRQAVYRQDLRCTGRVQRHAGYC